MSAWEENIGSFLHKIQILLNLVRHEQKDFARCIGFTFYCNVRVFQQGTELGCVTPTSSKNTRNKGHKHECLKLSALTINIADKGEIYT